MDHARAIDAAECPSAKRGEGVAQVAGRQVLETEFVSFDDGGQFGAYPGEVGLPGALRVPRRLGRPPRQAELVEPAGQVVHARGVPTAAGAAVDHPMWLQ